MFRKILYVWKYFWTPKMVHWPKFFWRGGGRSPKLISSKKIIFGTGRAQSEKVGQISFCPPNFFLPVRPCRDCLLDHPSSCPTPQYTNELNTRNWGKNPFIWDEFLRSSKLQVLSIFKCRTVSPFQNPKKMVNSRDNCRPSLTFANLHQYKRNNYSRIAFIN
jgi:hypothetical protein